MNWTKLSERLPKLRKPYKDAPYSCSETVLIFTGSFVTTGWISETYTGRNRTLKLCVDPSGNVAHSDEVMRLFEGWRVVKEAAPKVKKI